MVQVFKSCDRTMINRRTMTAMIWKFKAHDEAVRIPKETVGPRLQSILHSLNAMLPRRKRIQTRLSPSGMMMK
jgi:hypothetical protein